MIQGAIIAKTWNPNSTQQRTDWTKKAWCWPRWILTTRETGQSVSLLRQIVFYDWRLNLFRLCATSSKSGRPGVPWTHCVHRRQSQQAGNCTHLSNSRRRLFDSVHVRSLSSLVCVSVCFRIFKDIVKVWRLLELFGPLLCWAATILFLSLPHLQAEKIPLRANTGRRCTLAKNSPRILKVCHDAQNIPNTNWQIQFMLSMKPKFNLVCNLVCPLSNIYCTECAMPSSGSQP